MIVVNDRIITSMILNKTMDLRKEDTLTEQGVQVGTGNGSHINIHLLSLQNLDQ